MARGFVVPCSSKNSPLSFHSHDTQSRSKQSETREESFVDSAGGNGEYFAGSKHWLRARWDSCRLTFIDSLSRVLRGGELDEADERIVGRR